MLAHIHPQSTIIQNPIATRHLHSHNLANILMIPASDYTPILSFFGWECETIPLRWFSGEKQE